MGRRGPRDRFFVSWFTDNLPTGMTSPQTQAADAAAQGRSQVAGELESGKFLPPAELMRWLERDNQLLQVRLGIASSLFLALRCKSSHTASHCLRVTMLTGAWGAAMGLPEKQRDTLEVASLLHDIGKIGVPDRILLKPGPLTPDESHTMEQYRLMGREILRPSCNIPEVLEIVHHCAAWYDGSRSGWKLRGDEIPLGARMLAIADAYDAMTTDQVYRPAMSPEMALAELYRCAGKQFDPELVKQFATFQLHDPKKYHYQVLRRWLKQLDPELTKSQWCYQPLDSHTVRQNILALFCRRHLETTRTGIVFVDPFLKILYWNPGAERLTGISKSSAEDRLFQPELLLMRDEDGRELGEGDFPVLQALQKGEQRYRRVLIRNRTARDFVVDLHVAPVMDGTGTLQGAVVTMHDVSPELSLVARCQSLYEMATRDPLTQVANRAELDRVHSMFVRAHLDRKLPCSLILADLDHFKAINDTYGHQAGDEVLKSFAKLLKSSCRTGDLVARYGGEEFAILCPDCDQAAAARRAEAIRTAWAQMPQSALGGETCTASFGVTEVQPGDTPGCMLARADRALYMAKESGRNVVMQLGTGLASASDTSGEIHPQRLEQGVLLEQQLLTPAPLSIAAQKLRGFVADNRVSITQVDGNHVQLAVEGSRGLFRRWTHRRNALVVDLWFFVPQQQDRGVSATRIRVRIALRRPRERRRSEAMERSRQLLASLKAYLMASELSEAEKSDSKAEAQEALAWGPAEIQKLLPHKG